MKGIQRETEIIEEERQGNAGRHLRALMKNRWIRYALVVAVILALLLIAAHLIKNSRFKTYEITELEGGNTGAFQYCGIEGDVLRYGTENARLTGEDGSVLWNVSYSMQAPALARCGSTVVLYDKNGTSVVICGREGQIGSFSTDMPILKAETAAQGATAAILEDSSDTWIRYYDPQGEVIASFKTAMDSTGYPLDIGLSEDGLLMAVSFLKYEDGRPKTELNFYNFGSAGQIQVDNQVSSFSYDNLLIPEVVYLDEDTCAAFREDGFTLFGGGPIPEEQKKITVEQEIVSIFHDASHIGLVLENGQGSSGFILELYGKDGELLFQKELDYGYQGIEIQSGQILLYNRTGFCVYSQAGVEKFRGELNGVMIQQMSGIGRSRFLLVTEEGLYRIQLK